MLCVVALALLAVFSYGETAITPVDMNASLLRQTLPQCPASCCKKYCFQTATKECTAGVAPALPTAFTCATPATAAKQCLNTFGRGCSASQCTPRNNCNVACGTVIDIAPIVTCN